MVPYIVRRIFLLLYVLLGVSLTIFLLMRLIPGDPALVMLGERATAAHRRGAPWSRLDAPLAVNISSPQAHSHRQFGPFDPHQHPRRRGVIQRFPATIELSLVAICLASVVGVLAGIVSATHHTLGWTAASCCCRWPASRCQFFGLA